MSNKQEYNKNNYSYKELIKESSVVVPIIKKIVLDDFTTSDLMKMSLSNAIKEGGKKINNRKTSNSYYINDKYGNSIRISREGLTHSKRRTTIAKRNLIINFSTVFKNAIKVNEAYRYDTFSSIYFSEYIYDFKPYIARFIIINDSINDMEIYSLYSFGTNKKEICASASTSQELISKISVKQLLNDVNSIKAYRESLSLDVLYKLNGDNYKIGSSDIQGLKY